MATSIQAGMTPTAFQLMPDGGQAQAVISIQNAGTMVDQYDIEVSGLQPAWFSLPTAKVALFPNDKDTVKIAFQVPKSNNPARAGTYPFTVTVRSRADQAQFVRIPCTLVVGAIKDFRAELSPRKVVGRKGRYRLTVQNGGNTDLDIELDAQDPEEACSYSFSPEEIQLEPGQKQTVQLVVKPRRGGWIGPRQQFDFQVQAKPINGEPKMVPGQIVHAPRFRTWKPFRVLARLAFIGALLAVGLTAAGGWSGLMRLLDQLAPSFEGAICNRLPSLNSCPTATATVSLAFGPPSATPTAWASSPTPTSSLLASPSATATQVSPTPSGGPGVTATATRLATATRPRPTSTPTPSATVPPPTSTPTATATVVALTWTPLPTSTFPPSPVLASTATPGR